MLNRIRFRELRNEDVDQLFKIYSDKEAMKYRGSKPMERIEDAALYVKNQKKEEGGVLTIRKGIELETEKKLIGSSMYRFDENRPGECEIGYSIGRAFWGKGFGHEIVKKLIRTLEESKEITEVIAWCNKENIASIKILEKNKFSCIEEEETNDVYLYRKSARSNS